MLSNRKEERRRGKVQLISATDFWVLMRKSLGDKRREISANHIQKVTALYTAFAESEYSRILETTDFGYRKITVERPLRLNFRASPERIARLREEKAFQNLAVGAKRASPKKAPQEKAAEEEEGRKQQEKILALLAALSGDLFKDRTAFEKTLDAALSAQAAKLDGAYKISAPLRKAILSALSERDETAEICCDEDAKPEPDPELRDYENVPLKEDIYAFFDREVKPHVPEAWINTDVRDAKDRQVGRVGYEINFNRYFYIYQPPRPLEEIESDIKTLEKEILDMLREVAA